MRIGPVRRFALFIAVASTAAAIALPSLAQKCSHGVSGARPKIVGGQQAQIKDWPGQAVLRLHASDVRTAQYVCGGTAIAERWVLTAAHCVSGLGTAYNRSFEERGQTFTGVLEVVLGVGNLDQVRDDNVFAIDQIIVREGYSDATETGQDLALIHLARSYRGPVARLSLVSSTDPATPPGAQVRVAGFGYLEADGGTNRYRHPSGAEYYAGSRELLETAVPTVSTTQCRAHYRPIYPDSTIEAGQLCAGYEKGERDSCSGDSGGPLVAYDRDGCPYQIGIVSWGRGCAGAGDYGVYTRVSYHAEWIKSHVGSLEPTIASAVPPTTSPVIANEVADQGIEQLESVLVSASGHIDIGVRGGNRVPLGAEVVFEATSPIAGRLIIIDINAAGEITQILPNKFTSGMTARVPAGQKVVVPGPGYGFTGFRAVEPIGKSKLIALVVPDDFPIELTVGNDERLGKGFEAVNTPTNYLMNLIQQIVATLSKRSVPHQTQDWGLGLAVYEIVR